MNREFERLRAEVEAKGREVKGLQEELQAVHFSQDSKSGRMLMAKCRALQVSRSRSRIVRQSHFSVATGSGCAQNTEVGTGQGLTRAPFVGSLTACINCRGRSKGEMRVCMGAAAGFRSVSNRY